MAALHTHTHANQIPILIRNKSAWRNEAIAIKSHHTPPVAVPKYTTHELAAPHNIGHQSRTETAGYLFLLHRATVKDEMQNKIGKWVSDERYARAGHGQRKERSGEQANC